MMKDEHEAIPKISLVRLPPSFFILPPYPFPLRRRLWPAELL
jgi:hypothetical protein